MRPFLVCLHDATPAYARETRSLMQDLAPLVGRRLSLGIVPDWHGEWPLTGHPDFCRLVEEGAEELLLHGCSHRRQRGGGPVSWLAEASDEMNELDQEETLRTVERAQRIFIDAFGRPSQGFLAPAWQRGHVRTRTGSAIAPDHVLGYFSLDSSKARSVPLATFTWDCGRWAFLGHLGHAFGRMLRSLDGRVPVLAIHPRDIHRGYLPAILGLIEELLDAGAEPTTAAGLLETSTC